MQLLDVILAFVLTIAGLATVVTALLEASFRILALRQKHLRELVDQLGKDVVAPGLAKLVGAADEEFKEFVDRFTKKVVNNPRWGGGPKRRKNYESVSEEHLLRRIVELEPMQKVLASAGAEASRQEAQRLLEEASLKFAELGSAASNRYRRNARKWSLIVGVALAFVLNVDGLRVLDAYMKDPALTAEVIANSDELLKELDEANESLASLVAANDEVVAAREASRTDGESVSSSGDEAAGERATPDAETAGQELDQIGQHLRSIQADAMRLPGLGVPMGSGYYPHCLLWKPADRVAAPDPRCRGSEKPKRTAGDAGVESTRCKRVGEFFCSLTFSWIFATGVTGLLIGLGGPFWYDFAQRIASVRTAFSGEPPPEEQLSGETVDAHGPDGAQARKALISQVLDDAKG